MTDLEYAGVNEETGEELSVTLGQRREAADGGALERAARAAIRRARRAQEYRERIYHAALTLFAERGLQQVTVEQITERAEVGKGTFFNYFDNKEAVIADFIADEVCRLKEALATGQVRGNPSEQILHLLMMLATQPQLTREFARGLFIVGLSTKDFRRHEGRGVLEVRALITEIVAEGQRTGHFAPVCKSVEGGEFLLSQYHLAMLSWCSDSTLASLPEIAEHYVRLGLRALRP